MKKIKEYYCKIGDFYYTRIHILFLAHKVLKFIYYLFIFDHDRQLY